MIIIMLNRSSLRRLVICADDYGISPAVSLGIRQLAERGRISATGAMTCMPGWASEAPALRPLTDRIEVGLHFTLTDQQPLTAMPILAPHGRFPSIGALIKASLAHMIPLEEVTEELTFQLNAFEAHFGRPPDFIDGHQHIHLLPGIRSAVLHQFHHRLDPTQCWLRDCSDRPLALMRRGQAVKAGIVAALGYGLTKAAHDRGIAVNDGFTGFYDGSVTTLAERFPTLLKGVRDRSLLMVHPGHVDAALEAVDSLIGPRQREWDFLSSDALPPLLALHNITIAGRGAVLR